MQIKMSRELWRLMGVNYIASINNKVKFGDWPRNIQQELNNLRNPYMDFIYCIDTTNPLANRNTIFGDNPFCVQRYAYEFSSSVLPIFTDDGETFFLKEKTSDNEDIFFMRKKICIDENLYSYMNNFGYQLTFGYWPIHLMKRLNSLRENHVEAVQFLTFDTTTQIPKWINVMSNEACSIEHLYRLNPDVEFDVI